MAFEQFGTTLTTYAAGALLGPNPLTGFPIASDCDSIPFVRRRWRWRISSGFRMRNGRGIAPLLPTDTRGMAPVDDRRVLSGIVHALQSGGRWGDCPEHVYGPKKTLYNRFVRWAERGVWEGIFNALAGAEGVPDRLFIDSTSIKAHRTAGSAKGGLGQWYPPDTRRSKHQGPRSVRCQRPPACPDDNPRQRA